jgi:hypothetical protein
MKRSMIVVCLLLLPPGGVMACYEDHSAGAGWFDEQTSRWSSYGSLAEALYRDRLMGVSVFAGGSGIAILVGVFIQARCRARQDAQNADLLPATGVPLAESVDQPPCEPLSTAISPDFQVSGSMSSESFGIVAQPLTSVFLPLDFVAYQS